MLNKVDIYWYIYIYILIYIAPTKICEQNCIWSMSSKVNEKDNKKRMTRRKSR